MIEKKIKDARSSKSVFKIGKKSNIIVPVRPMRQEPDFIEITDQQYTFALDGFGSSSTKLASGTSRVPPGEDTAYVQTEIVQGHYRNDLNVHIIDE